MSRRNDEQRARDAAQARARRLRRELEVLAEVCQHGSVQDAASCLDIAYSTAKNHLSSLYQRIGAFSVPHALLLLGWVDVPSRARRPHLVVAQAS